MFKNLEDSLLKPLELTKTMAEVYGCSKLGSGGAYRSEQGCASKQFSEEKTDETIAVLIKELENIYSTKAL